MKRGGSSYICPGWKKDTGRHDIVLLYFLSSFLITHLTVIIIGNVMRTTLTLEDDSRPAELQSCHPRGDSRLALKMRPGGLIRVYDGALVPGVSFILRLNCTVLH